jgi:hypothetical protein
MALVILGLLAGLVGLVCVMVIDIVLDDRQSSRRDSPKSEMPVNDQRISDSKAA